MDKGIKRDMWLPPPHRKSGGGFNGRYPFGWIIPKPGGPDPLPEDEAGGTWDERWPK